MKKNVNTETFCVLASALILSGCLTSEEKLIVEDFATPLPTEFYMVPKDTPVHPESTEVFYVRLNSADEYVFEAGQASFVLSDFKPEEQGNGGNSQYLMQMVIDDEIYYSRADVNIPTSQSVHPEYTSSVDFRYLSDWSSDGAKQLIEDQGVLGKVSNRELIISSVDDLKNLAPYFASYKYSLRASDHSSMSFDLYDLQNAAQMKKLNRLYIFSDDKAEISTRPPRVAATETQTISAQQCIGTNWSQKSGLMQVFNKCSYRVTFNVCTKSKTTEAVNFILEALGSLVTKPEELRYECQETTVGPRRQAASFIWSGDNPIGLAKILSASGYTIPAYQYRQSRTTLRRLGCLLLADTGEMTGGCGGWGASSCRWVFVLAS